MGDSPNVAAVVGDLIREPTRIKFGALILLTIFGASMLYVFEYNTAYFSGQHTLKEVEVLERLVALRTSTELAAEEETIRSNMLKRLTVSATPSAPIDAMSEWAAFSFTGDRFLYGLLPWLAFILFALPTVKVNKFAFVGGAAMLGLMTAVLASLFPSEHLLTKLVIVPFIVMAGGIAITLIIGLKQVKQQMVRAPQKQNHSNE